MDELIDQFIVAFRSQHGVKSLSPDELQVYIDNEIIDEQGNLLIELPEPKYYTNAIRESIYKHREKNKKEYNKICLDHYHKRMEDPKQRQHHNELCKMYNRKRRARIKQEKLDKLYPAFTIKFEEE